MFSDILAAHVPKIAPRQTSRVQVSLRERGHCETHNLVSSLHKRTNTPTSIDKYELNLISQATQTNLRMFFLRAAFLHVTFKMLTLFSGCHHENTITFEDLDREPISFERCVTKTGYQTAGLSYSRSQRRIKTPTGTMRRIFA